MPPVRDKRYTIPTLWIDLFEPALTAEVWTRSSIGFTSYDGNLQDGDLFTGVFSFKEEPGSFGLFEAKVVRREGNKMLADYTWVSDDGNALLERQDIFTNEKVPRHLYTPEVSSIRRTNNWSFSGLLVEYNDNFLKPGDRVNAMVRVEKSSVQAIAQVSVIRNWVERKLLALRFTSLSSEAFALLESAIKKQGRP